MRDNVVVEKSFVFAVRIVEMAKYLIGERREFVLSKQVLRSGTSIGANVEEAQGGQSKADFYAKMSIAYKEARETSYWLRLLFHSHYLTESEFHSIHDDLEELLKLISAIKKSISNS